MLQVMVNRKWAFRALYDNEDEAARAYDNAVRRLKPNEASSYVNFKDHTGARRTPATKVRKSGHRCPSPPSPNLLYLASIACYACRGPGWECNAWTWVGSLSSGKFRTVSI